MIKKLLIRKAKTTYLEDQKRNVVVSPERVYFIEDISKDYHCSDGVFDKKDLNKKDVTIKSNTGKEFFIINAQFLDSYKGLKKSAQTIPLKDLGFIFSETGLDKNSIVIDSGTGSGGSSIFFAKHVKKVYSFDISASNIEQAKNNALYLGIKNIVFKQLDIYNNTPNIAADLVLLDVPEPWSAILFAYKGLKSGGFLISYCPQITQTQAFVNKAIMTNFIHVKTVEINERDWKIEGLVVRPRSLSNIHSGFVSILRKIV
jgi:tRNA (adenine57-N1/adenine58-N1)-methyltransferase